MAVMNAALHRTLQRVFRDVRVANAGARAHVRYVPRSNGLFADVTGGEYYLVRCPACRDHKPRLWISYMYGTFDLRTQKRILHTAICYHCGAKAGSLKLSELLKGPALKQAAVAPMADISDELPPLQTMQRPDGYYVMLDQLEPGHPARQYIESRGYSVTELSRDYVWMYAESPDYLVDRRIFIPIFAELNGSVALVGYQTRAIPGYSPADEPKYWTAPGFRKSQALYNLYRARHCARVVITEGVTAATRVGREAVALFGKSMSYQQIKLLLDTCSHADICVMLDHDAEDVGRRLVERLSGGALSSRRFKGVHMVALPRPDSDPGEYQQQELSALLDAAIAAGGVPCRSSSVSTS